MWVKNNRIFQHITKTPEMPCLLNYAHEILHDIYLVKHPRFLTEPLSYTWFSSVTGRPPLLYSLFLNVTQSHASFIFATDFDLCLKSHACLCVGVFSFIGENENFGYIHKDHQLAAVR
jgi:hypothetical protein